MGLLNVISGRARAARFRPCRGRGPRQRSGGERVRFDDAWPVQIRRHFLRLRLARCALADPPEIGGIAEPNPLQTCASTLSSPLTSRPGSAARITPPMAANPTGPDRKSTRLNSSHLGISYAVFCL